MKVIDKIIKENTDTLLEEDVYVRKGEVPYTTHMAKKRKTFKKN